MIYRTWSLLTGPVTILGGIVGTAVVAHFLFIEKDRFLKSDMRKEETAPSSK